MSSPRAPSPTDLRRRALLQELPPDERRICDRYYQDRLHAALAAAQQDAARDPARAADPLEIEQTVITALMHEAEGVDDPRGVGAVPVSVAADGTLLLSDLVPPQTDPRRGRPGTPTAPARGLDAMPRGRLLGAGAGVVVALVALLASQGWLGDARWYGASMVPPARPSPAASAWPVAPGGDLAGPTPVLLELPIAGRSPALFAIHAQAASDGQWTPTFSDRSSAVWLADSLVNQVLCLPPAAGGAVQALTRGSALTVRRADGDVRHYEVVRVRDVSRATIAVLDQRRAGLTLVVCGGAAAERTVAEAIYRADPATSTADATGPVALAGLLRVELTAVRVLPATADLPPGQRRVAVEVTLTNLQADPLPWNQLADQLEVAGQLAQALPPVAAQDALPPGVPVAVTYHYVAGDGAGAAIWRLIAPTGESVALTATLPPAADAELAVAGTLRPEAVFVSGSGRTATLSLTLDLLHRDAAAAAPALVTAQDVSVWAGPTALALIDARPALPLTVAPADTAQLRVTVAAPRATSTVVVQLGAQRWRVDLPPHERR